MNNGCEGFEASAPGFVPGVKPQLNVGVVFGTPRLAVLSSTGRSNMLLVLAGGGLGSGTFPCSSGVAVDDLDSKKGCAEGWPKLKPLNPDGAVDVGWGVAAVDEG